LKNLIKSTKLDFWDELSASEKEEIQKGIQQLNNNERISFDEFPN